MEGEPMTAPILDEAVRSAFDDHPEPLRAALLNLRRIILATAADHPTIGVLTETLKWGEPAYLPRAPRIGTTVRLGRVKTARDAYGAFFHCQTTLIQSFRMLYPEEFSFDGARAIVFSIGDEVPKEAFRHCIALALTYHLRAPRGVSFG